MNNNWNNFTLSNCKTEYARNSVFGENPTPYCKTTLDSINENQIFNPQQIQ